MTGVARYMQKLYEIDKLNDTQINNAVNKGFITVEEFKIITGEDYEVV